MGVFHTLIIQNPPNEQQEGGYVEYIASHLLYTIGMLRRYVRTALVLSLVFAASTAMAATVPPQSNPNLDAFGVVVSDLYSYSLRIVGLCVFVMFLIAGLTYIIPGLQKKFGDPWQIIKDAVIGLILLFSAYLILNTINPDLVGGSTPATRSQ